MGGVSREFFTTIMKEMLSDAFGLFAVANTEQFSYKIADDSRSVQGYSEFFTFFGRLLGKALFDRVPLNLCLNRTIYMAILGQTSLFDYKDIKKFKLIDENVHSSLSFILENDLTKFEDTIDLNFTVTLDTTGTEIELKNNGENIKVVNENKEEFAHLKCHYMGYKMHRPQLEKIQQGFYEVVPREWVHFLTVDELETALCGQNDIDLTDWKSNTEYRGFILNDKSVTVYRFWYAMGTYSQAELGRILQYCTGTSRLPLGGFSELES